MNLTSMRPPSKYDVEYPNVFEKFLETRLNYAAMSATGEPAPKGLIDTVIRGGECRYTCSSLIRDELWVKNKYPHAQFFGPKLVRFSYPTQINEILNLRFSKNPFEKEQTSKPCPIYPVYDVSFHELVTIPSWGPPSVGPERQACCKDVPQYAVNTHPICCQGGRCASYYCAPPVPAPLVAHGRPDCYSTLKPR